MREERRKDGGEKREREMKVTKKRDVEVRGC